MQTSYDFNKVLSSDHKIIIEKLRCMTLTMNSFKNDLHCALTDCSENDSVETQIFEEIFIFKVCTKK